MAAQVEGRERALDKMGYLWWMDPGLGKTGTTLDEFCEYRARGEVDSLAVVSLNSFQNGWVDEAANEGVEGNFKTWPQIQKMKDNFSKVDAFVINYEALIHHGGDVFQDFVKQRRTYLAFDECQQIMNPGSQVTKRATDIWKDAFCRRGLSGTPTSGSVLDLFPQLKLAGKLGGMNQIVFKGRYAIKGGFMGKKITGYNEKNKPELDAMLLDCAFRAKKKDYWKDCPEKDYRVIKTPMPDNLKAHYQTMLEEFVVELPDNDELITAEMIVSQHLKLQQISSGFVYDGDRIAQRLADPNKMQKYQALHDILFRHLGNSKVIIFTHFRPTTQIVAEMIEKWFGKPPALFIGGMDPDDIKRQKAAFNSDSGPDFLVAQSSVGSASHTLLGGEEFPCFTEVYFENTYRLITRQQAEDRIHRYGQTNGCMYYDLSSSPVEEKVIKALQDKTIMADNLLSALRQGWN